MNLVTTKWTDSESGLYIEVTSSTLKGALVFAVRDKIGNCLSKSGSWDAEPMPSTRSPKFIANHRYGDWKQAAEALDRAISE